MSENSPSKKKRFIAPLLFLVGQSTSYAEIAVVLRDFFFLVPFPLYRLLPKSHPCPKVIGSSIPRNDHKCKKVKECGKSDFQRAVTRGELPSFLGK